MVRDSPKDSATHFVIGRSSRYVPVFLMKCPRTPGRRAPAPVSRRAPSPPRRSAAPVPARSRSSRPTSSQARTACDCFVHRTDAGTQDTPNSARPLACRSRAPTPTDRLAAVAVGAPCEWRSWCSASGCGSRRAAARCRGLVRPPLAYSTMWSIWQRSAGTSHVSWLQYRSRTSMARRLRR